MSASKYKEEYCQMLIDHMSQGMSYDSFGAVVNCGLSTLYDWEKQHEEWTEAKKIAFSKALSYYEKLLAMGVTGIEQKDSKGRVINVNTSLLIFALKTRFHKIYGDRMKHEGAEGAPIEINYVRKNETND